MGTCQTATDIEVPSNFTGIIITCRSWKKTYSNLYDYAAQPSQYIENNMTVNLLPNQSYSLVKIGEQLKVVNPSIALPTSKHLQNQILKLTNKNQNYIVMPSENIQKLSANQLWLAVKSTPSHKYKLKEGDLLRIGNQKVKVKEIVFEDNVTEANQQIKSKFKIYENMTKQNSQGYDPNTSEEQPTCRVCLQEGEINNPLIAPCKCSGSAKFIHIKCIQQWFNKLINPRTVNSSIIISWKPLICELCNQSLPFKIYLDQVKHFTVNIPRPEKPYIVLNPLTKQKNNIKIYHLISFSKKKVLNIGRKKEADIILDEDTSVSRFHSVLELQSNKDGKGQKVTISDKDSKFGTLVLLKKPIDLSKFVNGLTFQFGGNIVKMICKANNANNQLQINQSQKSTSTESAGLDDNIQQAHKNERQQHQS